ncbi:MAG: primosomal protein N' [Rhodospirillales bacterium]|nr:primosomal protein N' [Rhodospirillales bacterium]
MSDPLANAAEGPGAEERRCAVLLPLPLAGAFDYLVPPGLELEEGAVVQVPLGGRDSLGVVWGPGGEGTAKRLKAVRARLGETAIPEISRRFVEWVADYVMAPPGAVLRMLLSSSGLSQAEKPRRAWRLAKEGAARAEALRMTDARRRLLALAEDGLARSLTAFAEEAGAGTGAVKGLIEAGVLEEVRLPALSWPRLDPGRPGPALSAQQQAAADRLAAGVGGGFAVTLLDGVTGSGKTEVYLEAVAAALAAGRQVLVLLPEIALSAQLLDRFAARFGARPAAWHSELGQGQRRRAWRAVLEGRLSLVVGARSALFLPFRDLGLIVVDEEHEAAFKQEDGVHYHARDMAVARGQLGGIPVILASATPSLESLTNAAAGRYGVERLPQRHGSALLPKAELIDMRRHRPPPIEGLGQSWLSPPLRSAIAETLAQGGQALLFLNRRGYAPLTLCRACGHRLQCRNCSAWMVEHRLAGRLQCHHCGDWMRLPQRCPECDAEDSLAACGPGVERLAEEAAALFPEARRAVFSSDLLAGPGEAAALLRAIADRKIDLLIGTQLVAKGHHFPDLTLVGVVDGDLGLNGGDPRAGERSFQLLQQVAGRAGRAERPGRALVQTFDPGHPVMQALGQQNRDAFLAAESRNRRLGGLPPFGRQIALIVSAPSADRADAACALLSRAAPRHDDVRIWGPAPAPLPVLRGRHRRRFLVQGPRGRRLQGLVRAWLKDLRVPAEVRVAIDVDPQSFL